MFKKLRAKLAEFDIDQAYLSKKLGISQQCVSNRFTGKYPWRLNEMYAIIDLIQEPYELLSEYFPKDGRDDQRITIKKPKITPEDNYRTELIGLAYRILYELDGKKAAGSLPKYELR